MRVLVRKLLTPQQAVTLYQQGDDVLIALEHVLTYQMRQAAFGGIIAIVIHRESTGNPYAMPAM